MGEKVDVIALAAKAGVESGKTINVVFSAEDQEMRRELTSVEVQRQYGRDWLIWKWKPVGSTPWGTADCGFAGNAINEEFIAELQALANVGGAK